MNSKLSGCEVPFTYMLCDAAFYGEWRMIYGAPHVGPHGGIHAHTIIRRQYETDSWWIVQHTDMQREEYLRVLLQ